MERTCISVNHSHGLNRYNINDDGSTPADGEGLQQTADLTARRNRPRRGALVVGDLTR
jgi:hypothetical protein